MNYSKTLKKTAEKALNCFAPPADLSVSEWADQYRMLSPEASAEPGRWRTDRASYQRGIMDAFSDPKTESVVFMKSAQVGATELLNNICGFFVDQDPSPVLVVQPTLDMAQTWSKDRLAPMLRDSPSLRRKVSDVKSRNSANTILQKVFPGGHLTICGANSPSSLASRPIRVVLCDEVDRYPLSAGSEGDPVDLARKRSTTYWNRKLFLCSTPTVKGLSRIEAAYELSDQRRFFVPCPHCEEKQALQWKGVEWPKGQPDLAEYRCESCGAMISELERKRMIQRGRWVALQEFTGTAGFHLNELYSPWSSMGAMARAWMDAHKLPEALRVFINTSLGETWEEDRGETVDDVALFDRREDYGKTVPSEAALLTAGADVQDDRVEIEIVAWGADNESWSLDYITVYGDMDNPEIDQRLDEVFLRTYPHEGGGALRVEAVCIDSQGHKTDGVYRYVSTRHAQGVYAIKGMPGEGRPLTAKPSRNNRRRVRLFPVGVDTAKALLHGRLKTESPGPGYCHFPLRYEEEYFRQLTSEKLVTKYSKGRPKRQWVAQRKRNEALDCRVYAMAAYSIRNPNMDILFNRLEHQQHPPPTETKAVSFGQAAQRLAANSVQNGRPRPSWFTNRR